MNSVSAILLLSRWSVVAIGSPAAPPDFARDVLPVLTRAGCNAGACHGAALGQDGFRLSLLGGDPAADHAAISRAFRGRRVNLADPDSSLVLLKPSGGLPHKGGKPLPRDSAGYRAVREWIAAGAPTPDGGAMLASLDVSPPASLSDLVSLKVTARYSDGTDRDVTALALFDSLDDSVAAVTEAGAVSVLRPGETSIMIRYGGRVATARVGRPRIGAPPAETPVNLVDAHVAARWRRLGLPGGERADDDRFRRRLWLDLAGRLPEEGAPDPVAHHSRWLSEQLGVPVKWGEPYDRLARRILTGPDAAFYGDARDPRLVAEKVARSFLGRRIQCAQCHNHPFESFTQDDYYGFTAFFARLDRSGESIVLRPRGEAIHPRHGGVMAPAFPGGVRPETTPDRRPPMADWIIRHPDFARAIVNRLWARFFGTGLVDPVDDLRSSNPPSNPELLEALARDLAEHGFDLDRTVTLLVTSNAYRRNDVPRTPPPEVFRTMLAQVLGRPVKDLPSAPGLEQTLNLLNGIDVSGSVPESDVVEKLFRRALGRSPTAEEGTRFAECERSPEAAEDLLWALINSKEFRFIP